MLCTSLRYCLTRTTCTVLGSISNFLPGGAGGMLFTYPAAITSLNVFGRRRCSKLYLRSAWVSSASAADSCAPDKSERASAVGVGSGTAFSEPSAATDCPDAEAGADTEVSGRFPQPKGRTAMADARINRRVMLAISQNF